ncbi:MAG: RecX family transcriptional regulator [Cyclobacteriaceae bacterium]|jgi:regulatory protein|nr:RecX family transcriptional regulator [Cyclobacteriaceae bacterium]
MTEESKPRKRLPPTEAWAKIQHYCAYQERSHREVKEKLYSYGLFKNEVEELLTRCITEGFLNEERFAKAFAGGKFRMKKWGRLKIERELQQHGLSPNCIGRGLKELDPRDYAQTLRTLLAKKLKSTPAPSPYARKNKVARYAIGKGYEPELVWRILQELLEA